MYHYLKWAALGLFVRRNARYLTIVLVSLLGIYAVDALYRDLADYAVRTGQSGRIGEYLLLKWIVVAVLVLTAVGALRRLGGMGRAKEREETPPTPKTEEDPILRRLEKFREPDRLRRSADRVIARRKKG